MSDEQIYAYILGDALSIGKAICSPLPPEDSTPSFWLFEKEGRVLWHDARISHKADRRAIGLLKELYGDEWKKHYAALATSPVKAVSLVNYSEAVRSVVCKEFEEYELPFWEAHSTTARTLNKLHIYALSGYFVDGECIDVSTRNNAKYAYVCSSNAFQVYKPYEDRQYRFRGHNLKGTLFGWNTLETGGDLIIASSMKDVVMFYNLGYKAIAPTSESVFSALREKRGEINLRFNNKYIVFDNDRTGINSMRRLEAETGWKGVVLGGKEKDPADIVKRYSLDDLNTICLRAFKKEKKEGIINLKL